MLSIEIIAYAWKKILFERTALNLVLMSIPIFNNMEWIESNN